MAGAETVGAGVAAADDENSLACGKDGDGRGNDIACISAVLLRQKLHGVVNALQFAAGDIEIAWMLRAAAKHNRFIVCG
jgi:hypothetical protein